MKKWIQRILWLCLTSLLLCGCQENTPESTEPFITWDSIPQLTYGQMEAEKLSVLPWYSGRTEISTGNSMAETELGYYMIYDSRYMFYADKVDLSNWVMVCNQPDCEHYESVRCNAYVSRPWLFVKDGRLYYLDMTGKGLDNCKTIEDIYVSAKLDGSDKRLEYAYEESHIGMMGGVGGDAQLGEITLRKVSRMDAQGEYTTHFYRIDKQGGREVQLPGTADENTYLGSALYSYSLRGEPVMMYGAVLDDTLGYYRLDGEAYIKLNFGGYPHKYGYFDGKTLRTFLSNDGYYDVNTETGEAVKLAPCYYEESWAVVLAPNCILETNMIDTRYLTMPAEWIPPLPEGESKVALFDGESWREVMLPPELRMISMDTTLKVVGLTSDSVLIYIQGTDFKTSKRISQIYRIPFGEDELRLEYCGEITLISDKEKIQAG